MPQNIYDDDAFFEGYARFARSEGGLSAAPEWPDVRSMLPPIRGLRVLDLGCGFGAFARWAVEQGADSVLAIDLSEKMLGRARELTTSDRIRFVRDDMSSIGAVDDKFELVYSALAIHYIEDFAGLAKKIRQMLVAGGRLVATVEHPLYTAPAVPQWRQDDAGRPVWPINRYLDEGERVTDWITPGVVKYHRTVQRYVNTLADNGFRLCRLVEWGPTEAQLVEHPEWAREVERPMFLLFSADAE